MPYIRCDKDCDPAAGQLSEAGVTINQPASAIVGQKISCIEYEVFNGDSQRSNLTGGGKMPENTPSESGKLLKQPDTHDGWNADYEHRDVDNQIAKDFWTGKEKVNASYYMVTQNLNDENEWYVKYDIDNGAAEIRCYERVDFFGCYPAPKEAGDPAVDDPTCSALGRPGDDAPISFSMDGEEVLLALQDDRDNIFVTENQIFHIRLEDNTFITDLVSDSLVDTPEIDWIVDESGNRYIETNGMYTRIEENPV